MRRVANYSETGTVICGNTNTLAMSSHTPHLCRRRLCRGSLVAVGLLVGTTVPTAATNDQPTRWLSSSLPGYVADDVEFGSESPEIVEQSVAEELPAYDPERVIAHQHSDGVGTVELLEEDLSEEAFGSAIDASGYSYGSISAGSTQRTRDEIIEILGRRLDEAGIEATVYEATTEAEQYIITAVSEADESTAHELLSSRGTVSIDIYHEDGGEYGSVTGLTNGDFGTIGSATEDSPAGPHVPVTVESSVAEEFQQQLVETGVAQSGGSICRYNDDSEATDPCLLLVGDGDVRNAFGMAPSLAESMQEGSWAEDPNIILTTTSLEEAQQVAVYLRSGALPVDISVTTSDEPPVDESALDERETVGADGSEDSEENGSEDGGPTDVSAPGYGIGAAVAALGAVGYLFGQRAVDE